MQFKCSASNRPIKAFSCPSKNIRSCFRSRARLEPLSAELIQIETKGALPLLCSGIQIWHRFGRLAKSQKVSVSVRIVLSSGETHLSSVPGKGVAKAENEFMSWGALQKRESFPLARVLCVQRERACVQEFVALCSAVADFQAVTPTLGVRLLRI